MPEWTALTGPLSLGEGEGQVLFGHSLGGGAYMAAVLVSMWGFTVVKTDLKHNKGVCL